MKVFCTVGTTRFDKLIDAINTPEVLKKLEELGYDEVSLQTGSYDGSPTPSYPIKSFTHFHYKDSILEDIKEADLVISHAGAGSCTEVLKHGKPLLVVVNRDLMDDHQSELATQLTSLQHAYMCHCSSLLSTLQSINIHSLKPYESGNPEKFIYSLNHVILHDSSSFTALPLFVSLVVFLAMFYPIFHFLLL